nr:MAG TPA: SMODS-associating 4TM effector domain [Caudoviricetes sp.]
MNTIAKKQNEKATIAYLAAARRLYSRAKCLRGIKVFLGVIIIALLAFLQLRYPKNESVSYALVMASVLAIIAEPVLDWRISAYKVKGAKMQQCFDNDLFGFSWNESVCGKRPTEDKVVDYCKGRPVKKKLYDWYKGIEADPDEDLAILLCQNQNGSYDRRLRERYTVLCLLFAVVLVAGVIYTALKKDATLYAILVYGVVPSTPIINWFISVFTSYHNDKEDLDHLDETIYQELNRAEASQPIRKYVLERIQNLMFMHRKAAYLIPDLFYKMLRWNSENRAAAVVERILARQKK